jgi:predicted glycosyltransferase involved in capsule biosynthesis
MNQIKISYCTSIMNRKYQLEKTLLINLKNLSEYSEIVIVDFGSTDGLREYIYNNFSHYLDNKKLLYYYTDKVKFWHASICKNTAHMIANGKYVVNLDCDNFIGIDSDKLLLEQFNIYDDDIIVCQSNYIIGSGNGGRITLSKNNFIKLGGYDESFYPMGYQDYDLIERAKKFGLKYIHINKNNNCIKNTKKESIINIGIRMDYNKMNNINKLLSKINIENNNLVVNKIKGIGICLK